MAASICFIMLMSCPCWDLHRLLHGLLQHLLLLLQHVLLPGLHPVLLDGCICLDLHNQPSHTAEEHHSTASMCHVISCKATLQAAACLGVGGHHDRRDRHSWLGFVVMAWNGCCRRCLFHGSINGHCVSIMPHSNSVENTK